MTGPAAAPLGRKHESVVDADFEIVPAREASAESSPQHSQLFQPVLNPQPSRRGGPIFWTIGLSMAVLAFWVTGGHAVIRPLGGQLLAGESIVIASVDTRIEAAPAGSLLLIDGEALNRSPMAQILPPITVAVSSPEGTVTRYRISVPEHKLGAGETYSFSSRLRVPAEGVKSVAVTVQPLD